VIDLHCHLDLYEDPTSIGTRVVAEGMYVLTVTTTPRAWAGTRALFASLPRIRVGLGLHPQLVAERHAEVDMLCDLIPDARYVGEIGLDGSPEHRASLDRQARVLRTILAACAKDGGRILSLHSRGAASAILDELEACPGAGTPILHWFSGTRKELDRAIALGCWFSVGPAMLRGQKGLTLASAMPRERILTETDGPFAQEKGRALLPWDVALAESHLSGLWEIPEPRVRELLLQNLKTLTSGGDQSTGAAET
jgi:TatD DNase family protein